jgi:hypothetical protein
VGGAGSPSPGDGLRLYFRRLSRRSPQRRSRHPRRVGLATTGTYAGSTGPVSSTAQFLDAIDAVPVCLHCRLHVAITEDHDAPSNLVSELLRPMVLVFAVLDLTGPQLDLSGRFVPGEGSFPPGPARRLGLSRRSARRPGWADGCGTGYVINTVPALSPRRAHGGHSTYRGVPVPARPPRMPRPAGPFPHYQ